jgi:4'-phosphopantetheinyl transferase
VHVWLDRVPSGDGAEARWRALLTPAELAAADRLRIPQQRACFVRARWLLRTLVGRYAETPPADVTVELLEKGKPVVVGPPGARGIEVSLSHSHDVVAVAFGRVAPLGVDVERERSAPDLPDVARRSFAPEELTELAAEPPEAWTPAFFRCWARKEAVIKATGEGLSLPLTDFAVSVGMEARLVRKPPGWGERWTLVDLAPGPGYAGALAVRGDAVVRLLLWTGA